MRLPDIIESEIRIIEAEWAARGGQQAGIPRARGLRVAIELILKKLGYLYTAEVDDESQQGVRSTALQD